MKFNLERAYDVYAKKEKAGGHRPLSRKFFYLVCQSLCEVLLEDTKCRITGNSTIKPCA